MTTKLPPPPRGANEAHDRSVNSEIERKIALVSPYRQLPPGGATGNTLVKTDARDYNVGWSVGIVISATGGVFVAGSAATPSISLAGDPDTGFYQVGTSNILGLTLGGENQMRFVAGTVPVRVCGNAASDQSRISHYTVGFATERGYWGYPTTSSDTMIIRNSVGATLLLRASSNTTVVEVGTDYVAFPESIVESGLLTPAQITANTDNYNPSGVDSCSVLRLDTDASRNLTGIVAQDDGTRLLICNVGGFNLVLVHDATSTAANRFYCPGSANYTLTPNSAVYIWYDTTSNRWRVVA